MAVRDSDAPANCRINIRGEVNDLGDMVPRGFVKVLTFPDTPEVNLKQSGRLQLAAVEYVVIKSAWDANHSAAPSLFGHEFMVTDAPNRYGLPAFYSLHVWAWDHNPMGTFEMWNPDVVCP